MTASVLSDAYTILERILAFFFDVFNGVFSSIFGAVQYLQTLFGSMPTILQYGFSSFLAVAVFFFVVEFVKAVL